MPSDSEWSFEQPKLQKRLRRQSFDRAQCESLILKEKAFFDSQHDFEVPSKEIQMKAITKNETEPGPKELESRKKKSIDDSTPVSPLLEQTFPAVASKPL